MRLPRAVAYLRCSTDKQPLSLEDQRRTIGRWADPRGVRVIRWYADEAMSGASASDRDGFQSMVQELEKQRDADLVLCYDISRFGRTDNDEAGYYRYRIRQAGAEVVYVAESAVTGGETDELLVPILQYQKREQLRALSRDTLRGTMGLAARGAWCGGPAPFGYTREVRAQDGTPLRRLGPGERAHNEDGAAVFLVPGDRLEIEAVRLAWDLRYLEWKSYDAIRDRIAELGVPPRRSSTWRSSSVRVLLLNPVYTGRMTYGTRTSGKFHRVSASGSPTPRSRRESGRLTRQRRDAIVVEGAHEPIVSPEACRAFQAWEREQADPARRPRPRARLRKSKYLLAGLLRCGLCGFRYVGHRTSSHRKGRDYLYRYYVCGGHQGSGARVCPRLAIRMEDLDELVLDKIRERWLLLDRRRMRRQVREALEKPAAPTFDPSVVHREVTALEARMVTLAEALDPEHADVTNRAIRNLKARRDAWLARLEEETRRHRSREQASREAEAIAEVVTQFPKLWRHATAEERKELLRCFLQGVEIHPERRELEVALWDVPIAYRRKEARPGGMIPPGRSCVKVVAGVPYATRARRRARE